MSLNDEWLVVRQRVEVARENEKRAFKSMILDVNESEFAIQMPTSLAGDVLPLHPGEKVEVRVLGENEQYRFITTVTGRKLDQVPMYVLRQPTEFQRVQLRSFVRIKCALEVAFQTIAPEDVPQVHLLTPTERGVTVDLSGGGMQMIIKEALTRESLVLVMLKIPHRGKDAEVPVVGKVMRCEPVRVGNLHRFVAGISFEQISEREQDKIVSFIFRKMVDQWRTTR